MWWWWLPMTLPISAFYWCLPLNRFPHRRSLPRGPMPVRHVHNSNRGEVTSSQLIASETFPASAVKALLYPGAITSGLTRNETVPRWSGSLDICNLTAANETSPVVDLRRLEVRYSFSLCPRPVPLFHIFIYQWSEQLESWICHLCAQMLYPLPICDGKPCPEALLDWNNCHIIGTAHSLSNNIGSST